MSKSPSVKLYDECGEELLFMHPRIYLAFVLLIFSHPVAAQTNVPALRMSEMFFQRCLATLVDEQPVLSEGLDLLSEEAALWFDRNSGGRVWMARDAHVSLSAFIAPIGTFEGCSVYWHGGAANGRRIDLSYIIAEFDRWADQSIMDGSFVEARRCGDPRSEYSRGLDSRVERSIPIRVFVFTRDDLNFAMIMASEIATTSEPITPCEQEP